MSFNIRFFPEHLLLLVLSAADPSLQKQVINYPADLAAEDFLEIKITIQTRS